VKNQLLSRKAVKWSFHLTQHTAGELRTVQMRRTLDQRDGRNSRSTIRVICLSTWGQEVVLAVSIARFHEIDLADFEISEQYALMVSSYFVVRILQSFPRIESRDDAPWKESIEMTLSNANGVIVALFSN